MNAPTFLIVAGVNGAGKSSFTASRPELLSTFPLLDPDAIAKTINPADFSGSILAAGRQVLTTAEGYLTRNESFVVETTLSGRTYLQMAKRAKGAGYRVGMVYVGLADVELSIARVKRRVCLGGHNVPEDDIRRRYSRSMENLKEAIAILDVVAILDNSTDRGHQLVGLAQSGTVESLAPIPAWAAHLASTC
jgi:predicted ABC-type ATPase